MVYKRRRRCDCTKLSITDITKINKMYDEGEKPLSIATQFHIGLARLYKILRGVEKEGGYNIVNNKKPTEGIEELTGELMNDMGHLKEKNYKRKGRLMSCLSFS